MGDRRQRTARAILLGAVVLVASSCGFATDTSTENVADTSATLRGRIRNTPGGDTTYWFEYGTSPTYGTTTPHKTRTGINNSTNVPFVSEPVTGLDEGAIYHYRLCASGASGGTCSYDATFTTTTGFDSVTGNGTVIQIPEAGYYLGSSLSARSEPGGALPAGFASVSPGTTYHKWSDSGPVTCLRVDGNKATIGLLAQPVSPEGEPLPPYHRLIFIEDNGPTGDRYGTTPVADATTCRAATEADFPAFLVGGFGVPPVITSGDFVVHDHAG